VVIFFKFLFKTKVEKIKSITLNITINHMTQQYSPVINESKNPVVEIKLNDLSITQEQYKTYIGEDYKGNIVDIKKELHITVNGKPISNEEYKKIFNDTQTVPGEEKKEVKINIMADGEQMEVEEYHRNLMHKKEMEEFEKINNMANGEPAFIICIMFIGSCVLNGYCISYFNQIENLYVQVWIAMRTILSVYDLIYLFIMSKYNLPYPKFLLNMNFFGMMQTMLWGLSTGIAASVIAFQNDVTFKGGILALFLFSMFMESGIYTINMYKFRISTGLMTIKDVVTRYNEYHNRREQRLQQRRNRQNNNT
jgi:hypothetical protein